MWVYFLPLLFTISINVINVQSFFLEIPDEQFNLGHWSLGYGLLKKQDAKMLLYEIKTFSGGGEGRGRFT